MVIQAAIRSLVDDGQLSGDQAAAAMEAIMGGEATPAQIGAYLAALRLHGETPEIVAASARVMQEHAENVPVHNVIDICGTGGDGIDTFNVSTAASFVVAAAGARVAKHGNRAMSSRCGSADLLEAMGARTDLGGVEVARIIDECGFGFLFAQRFHPAMKHVAGPRRELGIRTVFNMLGPLTNPARPKAQLAGVGAEKLAPLMAEAFRLRGMERAMVVHSREGMDEISPAGPTRAWIVGNGAVEEREITPADFGLPTHTLEDVRGGTPGENAATLRRVLDGAPGPVTDFVVMNAAAALYVASIARDFKHGAEVALQAIASGRARQVADRYVSLTQEAAS